MLYTVRVEREDLYFKTDFSVLLLNEIMKEASFSLYFAIFTVSSKVPETIVLLVLLLNQCQMLPLLLLNTVLPRLERPY